MAPTKIFVGSLPEGTSTDDLRALFEAHGEVQECDVIKDYGFVHMANDADAQAAIAALNGHEFRGVAINVEQSRSRVRQKPGMGGKMTCFRCGKQGHWSKECRMGGGGGGPYGGGFRGQVGRPTPYDRRPPPAFERRPFSSYDGQYDEAPYDRRRPYDRFDGNRGGGVGGGYDDYGRGGAGVGSFDRPDFDDRSMNYYARRSPPREYYGPESGYSNGGGGGGGGGFQGHNRSRPPPYGAERFGGPPAGNHYGGRY